ncbi:MAG: hypothetical protein FJW34_00080 [Acidobacteria bacterium]|nr:hypothetical protein [Acidobacteriota bacterium]
MAKRTAKARPAKAGPTVQGKPIPEHLEHAIPHRYTDQGIDEFNAAAPRSQVRVRVKDGFDRAIEAREAAANDLIEPWSTPDPLQEAIDKVADQRPDMQYRALSDNVVKRRGMRGWDPAKDKRGETIKMAGMTLARMPKKLAEKRNAYYREVGNAALRQAESTLQEQQEKAIRDAKVEGVSPLKRRDVLRDTRNRERVASVGLSLHRGNSREIED